MTYRFIFCIVTIAVLSSCSSNKMFLQPLKVPANHKRLTMTNNVTGDTTLVAYFSGENHQPTFVKNNKDSILADYTIESVMFKSTNGNMLNGWLLKPKNQTPKITLLHLHANSNCMFGQYRAIEPLVKKGFQVFMFDYSGFGFSEGKAIRKNVLIDANAALDYLIKRTEVKNTKLVIYGQSFGGHLAAVVGTERQKDIDALVIEGAFSSHKDIAASHAGFFGRTFVKEMYSARKEIKNYKKPLLIIHSSEDKEIPFSMGQRIFQNANEPKEFFEIRKEHIMGPIYYTDEIANKITSLVSK